MVFVYCFSPTSGALSGSVEAGLRGQECIQWLLFVVAVVVGESCPFDLLKRCLCVDFVPALWN